MREVLLQRGPNQVLRDAIQHSLSNRPPLMQRSRRGPGQAQQAELMTSCPAKLSSSGRRALAREWRRLPVYADGRLKHQHRIQFRDPRENIPVVDAAHASIKQTRTQETLFANHGA